MYNLMYNDIEKELFEARRNLLQEKHFQKMEKKDLLMEIANQYQKKDIGRAFYEEFDPLICEGKLKVDMLYYQQLMEKLDEQYVPVVEKVIIDLFKNVKDIYEFINIKPELYGRGITLDLFNESTSEINRVLSKKLYEALDALFYKLSPEQRIEKYREKSDSYIREMMNEGVNPDISISFGIKTTILENLLTKISFPFTCWTRVKYLTESQDYGLVFDQEKLVELVDNFENQIKKVSKIVATCI